jgi:hypothetical protein
MSVEARTQSIYLLRTREYINNNTRVYKIGKSGQNGNCRFNQYSKGSELLIQMVVENMDKVEREVIQEFKKIYKHRKDIGREYFEGSEKSMISNIYKLCRGCGLKSEFEKISTVFPNYKDDYIFGGVKQLIKIKLQVLPDSNPTRALIKINWINQIENCHIIESMDINDMVTETNEVRLIYLHKLITEKIIENDKIYDLNSEKFIEQLNKCKNNFKTSDIIFYDQAKMLRVLRIKNNISPHKVDDVLKKHIYCDTVVDNLQHCLMTINAFCNNSLRMSLSEKCDVYLIKVENIYIDCLLLSHYLPSKVYINDNEEYCLANMYGKCIGTDDIIKSDALSYDMYNVDNPPWFSIKDFYEFIDSLKKFLSEKHVVNFKHMLDKLPFLNNC